MFAFVVHTSPSVSHIDVYSCTSVSSFKTCYMVRFVFDDLFQSKERIHSSAMCSI